MSWFHKLTKTVPEELYELANREVTDLKKVIKDIGNDHYAEIEQLRDRLRQLTALEADVQEELAKAHLELAEERRHRGKLERRISQCKASLIAVENKAATMLNTLKDV